VEERASSFRILFVGDVVGRPGRRVLRQLAPDLLEEENPDFVVINAENSAGGFGLTWNSVGALFEAGADVLTNGNHTWDKREAIEIVEKDPRVVRPANYPEGTPGQGHGVFVSRSGTKVGVVNLLGRVFMDARDCPFGRRQSFSSTSTPRRPRRRARSRGTSTAWLRPCSARTPTFPPPTLACCPRGRRSRRTWA
jgi:calcineurin-like phosphoesterase